MTHVGTDGRARMVDVGEKAVTSRGARAEAFVRMSPALVELVRRDALGKGSVRDVARLAGIMAAKRTADLIPLCHQLPLDHAEVTIETVDEGVRISTEVRTHGRTGVEMEALAAAAVAALTVIDMGKAVDRGMAIERLRVVEKWGGRSGHYLAEDSR
ncbi:MAG: cyclic pyranopterin monophosphate synthase MoaC [Leptolyngbya sp. PLA2]|nr:cyclic pyranopterin monophosphate synthase MoaC [Leptolyngbya sp.]MCE7970810.1 cyclic pyranopterin monophosphate synthase MoaC [Leptolyngbya sp. PL-A2]MCQ3939965.1 cyclic pyranopterin monophosphate synthase MoaC [cyanobacterium CYA1]MDL1903290.1 cyclic pyranopterin monophosphate synthase MoaC [Synechococcales cyanobacterium CNB]